MSLTKLFFIFKVIIFKRPGFLKNRLELQNICHTIFGISDFVKNTQINFIQPFSQQCPQKIQNKQH